MEFNPQKCKIICISTKKRPTTEHVCIIVILMSSVKGLFLCGVTLEQVESILYQGVTLNNKLKWSQHISSISNKASKVLKIVKRNL